MPAQQCLWRWWSTWADSDWHREGVFQFWRLALPCGVTWFILVAYKRVTHGFQWEGCQLLSVPAPTCDVGSWPPQGAHPPWQMKTCLSGLAPSPRPQPQATYHILNDFIFPVLPLYFEQVVTEVKQVEATLLAQQDDDGAASPIQAISETLPGSGRGSSWSERWGGWGRTPHLGHLWANSLNL